MTVTQEFLWTESQVVLGYIDNEVKRFHVFVANRIQQIHECSWLNQCLYVDTKSNPADELRLTRSATKPTCQIQFDKWARLPLAGES